MKSSNTATAQVKPATPIVEGNKGFTFAQPVSTSNLGSSISFELALVGEIKARIPRQIQLVMQEWLLQSGGKGFVEIQKLNDALVTKGLWKRPNGQDYNQDVFAILLHYNLRVTGSVGWGKNQAITQALGEFK
tara:strand:+ start:672 stop:1070 length:399 start_codon:yes stop_codon:yes gene_type:complete